MAPRERATLTVAEAARLLGIGRNGAYEAIERGDFPVEVVRVGRRIVVPARPLFALLGLDGEQPDESPHRGRR